MKIFLFALEAAALNAALSAQTDLATTNAVSAPAASAPAVSAGTNDPAQKNVLMRAPTEIFSDRGDFDLKTHTAIYSGNVRVINPQMNLTCEILTASVPEGGGRVDRIVAERNVVIDAIDNKGEHMRATSQKAVYTYKLENSVTNETIVLTGDPKLTSALRTATGDPIIWDRINDTFHGSNLHMIFQQQVKEPASKPATNSPAGSVNSTNSP